MASSTSFSYSEIGIFNIKTLVDALKFFIINAILAFIFLFLSIEEIEWSLFSFQRGTNDIVMDNTSWNITKIFEIY